MENLESIVSVVALSGSVVLIIFILSRHYYLVKKVIAENGFNPNDKKRKYNFLDIGCIVLSLGIGLGISSIYTTWRLSENTFYFLVYATIFICGGIGLIVSHFIRRKLEKE